MASDRVGFTPTEICFRWKLGRARLMGWIRDGSLKASNVGSVGRRPSYRIREQDLIDLFEARKRPPIPRRPRGRPRKITEPTAKRYF